MPSRTDAGADKAGGGFCSALLQPEEWDGIISVSGGNVDGHLESLDSFLAVHKESEGEHLEKVRGADYLAPDGGQLSQRRRQGGDPRRRGGSLPKLIDENKRPGGAPAKDGRHLGQILLKGALGDSASLDTTDARHDLICDCDLGTVARDEASNMSEVDQHTDMPGVAGLATEVWACHYVNAVGRVDHGVVGDVLVFNHQFLERVATILDVDGRSIRVVGRD